MKLANIAVESDRVVLGVHDDGRVGSLTYEGKVQWSVAVSSTGALMVELNVTPIVKPELHERTPPPNAARR